MQHLRIAHGTKRLLPPVPDVWEHERLLVRFDSLPRQQKKQQQQRTCPDGDGSQLDRSSLVLR